MAVSLLTTERNFLLRWELRLSVELCFLWPLVAACTGERSASIRKINSIIENHRFGIG